MQVTRFILVDISKASVRIKYSTTVSASVTKLNGNSIFKCTTHSRFLVTGIRSAKLPGNVWSFYGHVLYYEKIVYIVMDNNSTNIKKANNYI
jgi:hypothetical protein